MARYLTTVALLAASLMGVVAHPGADVAAEAEERAAFVNSPHYRDLSTCSSAIKARDVDMVHARAKRFEQLRASRGIDTMNIEKRTFKDVLTTSHLSNKTVGPDSTPEEVFGTDHSCILQPYVTEGPYWVSGELVRQDITDGEAGVPLTFEVQLINVNTCEPLANVALEAWYCNSTGVYGGVSARGNGNPNDPNAASNTALRGINFSDDDGIVTFDAIMPGHYTGRAVHIHILAHIGATVLANGTISGGTIPQVGQLFFDQNLNNAVDKVAPYSTNTQAFTLNSGDMIMAQEAATSDPVLNYVLTGATVGEGIFGWATVGINPTKSYSPRPAAHYNGKA